MKQLQIFVMQKMEFHILKNLIGNEVFIQLISENNTKMK